jgi:streptogrisin C
LQLFRLVAMAALAVSGTAMAQVRLQTADEALLQDAASFAHLSGLPEGEALARLRAQAETADATDALSREFAGRLAGIWIEQQPVFRIVVRLTGEEPVASRALLAGGMSVPVDFVTGASATREELLTALTAHQPALRAALRYPPGLGIDPRSGSLIVLANAQDVDVEGREALAARLADIAGVPVTVRTLGREGDMAVEGGARVVGINPADGRRYACTTGFTVTDGLRAGVVTAAHCPDALSYMDDVAGAVPLEFVGQWGWGFQDVQVHATPGPLEPRFFADTAKTLARTVTGSRSRAGTRVGEVVCHRGERTGYSCAEIEMTDFAPAGDLCGGACLPTWVAVRGPTCRGGDSGGPVFLGTVAFGIVKGGSYAADGRCGFYYYMSTDYLPSGWSLLTAAAPGERAAIAR